MVLHSYVYNNNTDGMENMAMTPIYSAIIVTAAIAYQYLHGRYSADKWM